MGESPEAASSFVEIIAGIGSRMGLNSVPQPVSRNEVPYAVAKCVGGRVRTDYRCLRLIMLWREVR